MNTKEYISSGILELYAAGLLNVNEAEEVNEILKKNPEIREELNKINYALYLSASQNLKSPSGKVKDSIFKKINSESSEKLPSYTKQNNSFRYLMAASIAFLIFSLGVNFFLFNKLKNAEKEILALNEQKRIITQDFESVKRKLGKANEDIAIMHDRTYKMADLKGMEKSPSSNAVTFWNPVTKNVFIEVVSLPVPPPDKQYQLWALDDGKPIDAGVMSVDPSDKSLHKMKNIENAQAFAITLEPKGGSVNPTLSEMYAMGTL